jgi:ATP-binding cassette, subfamily B, bacterial
VKFKQKFPFYKQLDQTDCGPTCLRMIAKHLGKTYTLEYLREKSYIVRTGVSMAGIAEAAHSIGFRTKAVKIPFLSLEEDAPLPCIAHWRQRHFVVVYEIKKGKVYVADPGFGLVEYTYADFIQGWHGHGADDPGIVLLLEASPAFFDTDGELAKEGVGINYFWGYVRPYKRYMWQLVFGMMFGFVADLVAPFMTQAIVDRGIEYKDINFIYMMTAGQLMLFFSQTGVGIIQTWIMMHMSTRINISLISDFLAKMMRLPIPFFESRNMGDIMQRINDHHQIEELLTGASISTVFSFVNFLVYATLLAFFNLKIFVVFAVCSLLFFVWVSFFLKKRKELNFKNFDRSAENQSKMVELITGMQEIKMQNSEQQKRWEWERLQAKTFKLSVEGLRVGQIQELGASFIGKLQSIIISLISAKAVVDGHNTFGTMMAIQYIVGQASAPISHFVDLIQHAQDAKISFDRLNEIHKKSEENTENSFQKSLPEDRNLYLNNIGFTYGIPGSPKVLKNINLVIPEGKVTAIVGSSGSGKTTLLKLLLRFYEPTEGDISVGNMKLSNFHTGWWRSLCGTVMQDGFIFSDTIARNIAIGEEYVDYDRLRHAIYIANVGDLLNGLPLGLETKIGAEGKGMSQGQKQRIQIARAVYKDPMYMFFDEATSALDANNERIILQNLNEFFQGRTVIVVAHRLSTVKNADNIVVLHQGEIVEQGTHQQLVAAQGYYFNLVRNQLELGN